jgi:hypothetical protein
MCVRRGHRTLRSRRLGLGQDGLPKVVVQQLGLSVGFTAYSEDRVAMVVEAIRSVLHNPGVDWSRSWGPRPEVHQATLGDKGSGVR